MATTAAGGVARDGTGRLGDEDPVTGASRSARRYARAIFELALQDGEVDQWSRRLVKIRELSKRLDKDVRLSLVVDPRILGGMKLQYGDRIVDASVATRLEQLRRRLAAS